jgi:hypothetical protein
MDDEQRDPLWRDWRIPKHGRERARLKFAIEGIRGANVMGVRTSVADEVRKVGYRDAKAFFNAALPPRPAPLAKLFHFLRIFHLSPDMVGVAVADMALHAILREAIDSGEPFILTDPRLPDSDRYNLKRVRARLRGVAGWILAQDTEKGLLPKELREYLGEPKDPEEAKHGGGRSDEYPWDLVWDFLVTACEARGGAPDRGNPKGWRTNSAAYKVILDDFFKGKGPSLTTMKRVCGPMLRDMRKVRN